MTKGKTKKRSVFKAVCLALSAYIVRASIISALQILGVTNGFAISVAANISVIIIGGLYYNYCIKPLGGRVRVFDNKKLPASILLSVTAIAVLGFVLSGWFIYGGAFSSNEFVAASVKAFQNSKPPEIPVYLYFAYVILTVPFAEELIYRGFFFKHLYEVNKPAAYCVSVLFFAAVHDNILQMIIAAIGGALYAMIYVKTKSLRVCIAAHAAYNTLALAVSVLGSLGGLDRLVNPNILYNAFSVLICFIAVLGSFVLFKLAPAGLEIPRRKALTPEEQAEKDRKKAEWDEIYESVTAERIRKK